ncbi:MAG: DUF2142 domain-containing protein [Dehalococcoidia bacterium]|nr:DUF2142 domain-containing protein [Dehalococcoidia bacterium]
MGTSRGGRWPLSLLLFAFVVLATFYNVSNPIFESPDELWHFSFVRLLATGGSLPVLHDDASQNVAGQEGAQPPLYYAVEALATFWVDTRDFAAVSVPSPYLHRTGKGPNVVVHTAREDSPYRGTTLAVHIGRFVSTVMGAVTVLLTYLIALESFKGRRQIAFGAAAIVAFIPEFLFQSASVNNDNMITLASALTLFLSVRLVNRGMGPRSAWLIGLSLAVAALSKVSGLALAPLVVLAVLFRGRLERSFAPLRAIPLLVALVAAGSGWWFTRNWILYGDFLALGKFIAASSGSTPALTLTRLWAETQRAWVSTWALFGWSNLPADWIFYVLYGLLCLAGLLGMARRVRRVRRVERLGAADAWPAAAVLVAWVGVFVAAAAQYLTMINGMQGRLIFPALPALACLLAAGLSQMAPRRWIKGFGPALGIVLFIPAVIAPFLYIIPAYPRMELVGQAEVAAIQHRLDVKYGDTVQLLGYRIDEPAVAPGQPLEITLFWLALAPSGSDYTVFVHAFDAWGNALGGFDDVLEKHYPTSAWMTGDVLKETYAMSLSEPRERPSSIRIEVGLYIHPSLEGLPAYDVQGQPLGTSVTIARAKAPAPPVSQPGPSGEPVPLGKSMALAGYQVPKNASPGQWLEGRLWWRALSPPPFDYAVFVQLVGPAGLVAQYDSQPRAGSYPTSLWDAGETVEDFFRMRVPENTAPGSYLLVAGMYSASTGIRLESGGSDYISLGELRLGPVLSP